MTARSWQKIEARIRHLAQSADAVIIITGVLFESASPTFIGTTHVAVPSALYKIALVLHGNEKIVYAAIVPNAPNLRQSLNAYAVTVDEVEKRANLDFFPTLEASEQHRIESVRNIF